MSDSMFTGMKNAEQTRGGNYIKPGQHKLEILKHIVKTSQNKKKVVGKKFFIVELKVLDSTTHPKGTKVSWLVDFSKPGAHGNLKNYGEAIFPTLNPSVTVEQMKGWDDDQWDKMYTWLCHPSNPVHGKDVVLYADCWNKKTGTDGDFTMADWSSEAIMIQVAAAAQ